MKKKWFLFIILFLPLFLVSCFGGTKKNTDVPQEKPKEIFNYYYTMDDCQSLDTDITLLSENYITRLGYTFEGVFSGENGSGTQYFDIDGKLIKGMKLNKNINLYAKWSNKDYKLNLIVDNKTFKSIDITYGSSLSYLEPPAVKEGYDFIGYSNHSGTLFTDENGYMLTKKNIFTSENGYEIKKDSNIVELNANFKIKEYNITLDFGGRGTNMVIKVNHGSSVKFPKVQDYNDYECVGWNYFSKDGKKKYDNEPIVEDTIMYAEWLRYKKVIINYKSQVFHTIKIYQNQESVQLEDIELDIPKGYNFIGLFKNPNFNEESKITTFNYGMLEKEVYIQLELIKYNLNFSLSENEILVNTIEVPSYYTCEDEIILPTVEKGYLEFLGWCTDIELTSSPITKITKGHTGNIVLYPKFEKERVFQNIDEFLNTCIKYESGYLLQEPNKLKSIRLILNELKDNTPYHFYIPQDIKNFMIASNYSLSVPYSFTFLKGSTINLYLENYNAEGGNGAPLEAVDRLMNLYILERASLIAPNGYHAIVADNLNITCKNAILDINGSNCKLDENVKPTITTNNLTISGKGYVNVYGGNAANGNTINDSGAGGNAINVNGNLKILGEISLTAKGGAGGYGQDGTENRNDGIAGGAGGTALEVKGNVIISEGVTIAAYGGNGGNGGKGKDGYNGTKGADANFNSNSGQAGGNGGAGGAGGNSGYAIKISNSSTFSSLGSVNLYGGNGGNGGDGGKGGDGGAGGRRTGPGYGQPGGNGGDGGDGGNGGAGGQSCVVSNLDASHFVIVQGTNGTKGKGGAGGAGGDGGIGNLNHMFGTKMYGDKGKPGRNGN